MTDWNRKNHANGLRDVRKEKGLSQAQVADHVGVTQPTIGNWEAGIGEPSPDQIRMLEQLLGRFVTREGQQKGHAKIRTPNNEVRRLLETIPLPQVLIADQLGMSQSYISQLKNGRARISADHLEHLRNIGERSRRDATEEELVVSCTQPVSKAPNKPRPSERPSAGVTNLKTRPEIQPETGEEVYNYLCEFSIARKKTHKEQKARVEIAAHLKEKFSDVSEEYNVGGKPNRRIDIDIGPEKVGLEVKLEKKLTDAGIDRMLGQAVYYQWKRYSGSLIVVIVRKQGRSGDKLKEAIQILQALKIKCVWLKVH